VNKALVTGFATAKGCSSHASRNEKSCVNYDLPAEWIFYTPSILIWIDKLLISRGTWAGVHSSEHSPNCPAIGKIYKVIFDVIETEGLTEVFDPIKFLSDENIDKAIDTQISIDINRFIDKYPNIVKRDKEREKIGVPTPLYIGSNWYCGGRLRGFYESLVVSRLLDSTCLFDKASIAFYKRRLSLSKSSGKESDVKEEVFETIFEAASPNMPILPFESLPYKGTVTCKDCPVNDDGILFGIEKNVERILMLRDNDEICQLKNVIDKIITRRSKSDGVLNIKEIKAEFGAEVKKIKRRIKVVFPKVKRWSNILTLASIPISLVGPVSGEPLLSIPGAVVAGLSVAIKQTIELLTSKYSWIGFIEKESSG